MTEQQREVITHALEQYKGRDFATRTLARRIQADNPALFTYDEVEKIRVFIRYRRGAVGDTKRHNAKPEFQRDIQKPSEYIKSYITPATTKKQRRYVLPSHHRKVLIMSDLHIPYHELEAIQVALDYGIESGCDAIYLNGDVIDFARISRWSKDPHSPNVQVEVDMVREFLYGLTGFGLPIYYKMGNHEERWNAYLLQNAPELHDLDVMQMESVLGLEDMEITLIDSRVKVAFGKLLVIHGHEFGESFFNPVNPARGLFLKAKTSIVAGHNHQTSSHHENDLNDNPTATFSLGCLCDLSPDYRPFAGTKWNHGFAIVDIEEDGYFTVHNKRIIEGKVR
jgi:predicted phosphodiesterase